MTPNFEYGTCCIRDLQVPEDCPADAVDTPAGPRSSNTRATAGTPKTLLLDGKTVRTSKRFWTSLQMRFGFTPNVFKYFTHREVFQRISKHNADDDVRYCLESQEDGGEPRLLAVSNPRNAVVDRGELDGLLTRYGALKREYHDGIVRSTHAPRHGGPFTIAGDGFESQYVIETPIDGFGRPMVYLAMLRQVCTNGAIAMTKTFRSEINLGKSSKKNAVNATFGLERALEGFNNEEGFAALRQRFDGASRSWASIHEVARLGRILADLVTTKQLPYHLGSTATEHGTLPGSMSLVAAYRRITGDLMSMYGLANMDAITAKRQRSLPTACKVYDLLNFTSELATHHAQPHGARKLQGFIGDLVSSEFDLENSADTFSDWRDFFLEGSTKA